MRLGRPLLFVALGAALAGGVLRLGPAALRGRAPGGAGEAPPASDAGAEAGVLARASERAAVTFPGEEPAPAERTYYRYVDASGSLRFVDSLERVPDAFRASAKPMGMGAGSGENEAPRITRAETRAPRRPSARRPAQPAARRASEALGALEDEARE